MYSSADILARLRKGETPEDIANEMANAMAKALNAAQDTLKAEEAKAVQEKEKNEQLDALAARIADDVSEYLEVTAGTKLTDEERMTAEEVRELTDTLSPLLNMLKDAKITVKKTPHTKTVKIQSPDAVFAKFFKDMGI